MSIDPMDSDLGYPDPYAECKPLNYYGNEDTEFKEAFDRLLKSQEALLEKRRQKREEPPMK